MIKRTYQWWLLAIITLMLASCQDNASEQDETLRSRLLKTWQLKEGGYVRFNGIDITDDFTSLQYTFRANGTYSKEVNGDIFEGTWVSADNTMTTLVLDDNLYVSVLELTSSSLKISYQSDGSSGRVMGVGEYEQSLRAE
jgi:hypothetical protein